MQTLVVVSGFRSAGKLGDQQQDGSSDQESIFHQVMIHMMLPSPLALRHGV
jgi:hypothetical protein